MGHDDFSIRPGQPWLDTNGHPIQAHGFQVFYDEIGGRYIWYGENKETTVKGGTDRTRGIRWYTSPDFYHWADQGLLIPPAESLEDPLHPTYCIDRPHIIFCEKTGKYVCWIKVMAGGQAQFMTILQSDRFEGPYETVHRFYNPLQMYSGDFALHVDRKTKKGYIWFDRPHFQLVCATLTDDYTATAGEYSVHYDNLRPPYAREAPTYFEREGRKYLFTSGTTGYFPNRTDVCVFDDYHGEYRSLGDPCVDDATGTTFNSQITSVVKLHSTGRYIACADRWVPECSPEMAAAALSDFERRYCEYVPDTAPKKITSVAGKLQINNTDTCNSCYVWLPIEWDGEKPLIRWKERWTI